MKINKVPLLILGLIITVFIGIYYFTQKSPIIPGSGVTDLPITPSQAAINILVLGIGGGSHQSPDLTDTIIFTSLSIKANTITTVSIPRDVWIPKLSAKINSAYHSGGLSLAKSVVAEFVGQSIHYALVLDFSTFVKAIDQLGGIDVDVENTFTDGQYPIAGRENDLCEGDPTYACRYEQITFTKGDTHMNGEAALKFVRSRHSADPVEGTDFARSKRQSKVITAFQKKLLSSPKSFSALYNLASTSIKTDIPKSQILPLSNFLFQNRQNSIRSYAVSEPEHLYHPLNMRPYSGQWVLVPNSPDSITKYISSILK
ncbi:MAG: LCP family protein [Patescibacteria group bacterium]